MSTMQAQQLTWQGRTQELPTSSKQQPGGLPQKRRMGIQPGLAAVVLSALGFSLILCYAAACALTARSAYAEMALRREIEELRAETALLRYQVHLAESNGSIQQAAARLRMRPADPVGEVDYVLLPSSEPGSSTQIAEGSPTWRGGGLGATLAELATGMVGSAGGRAEASTEEGHRR